MVLRLFSARPFAIDGSRLPVTCASTKWGKIGDEFEHQKGKERVCSWGKILDHPGDFLQPVLGNLQLNPVSSLGVSCGPGGQVDCLLTTLGIHSGQVFVLGSEEPLGGCWESQLAGRNWDTGRYPVPHFRVNGLYPHVPKESKPPLALSRFLRAAKSTTPAHLSSTTVLSPSLSCSH